MELKKKEMVNIKMLAKVCEMEGKKEGAFDGKN